MYNVVTMVGSACSGSCNKSLTHLKLYSWDHKIELLVFILH